VSFILDALRKSEHERERRALPALVERGAGGARSSRLPLLLGALGVLLLANLVVLGVYLLRPAPPAAAPATPTVVAPAASPTPPATSAAGTAPRTRPLEAEAGEATGPALDTPEPPVRARAEPALVSARASARPPPAADAPAASAPSLNDLPEVSGLPHLSVQLHVYASAPADRFVVMNGQRLREGAALREGPVLERITPDGVILDYRGTRFQLPRQ
jgi:general secretion pathway protein B